MSKPAQPPEFCDFDCRFAAFPPAETAGICRTMSGVWCKKLTELVHKNKPCEWRRRTGTAAARRAGARSTPQVPRSAAPQE